MWNGIKTFILGMLTGALGYSILLVFVEDSEPGYVNRIYSKI